MPGEEVVLQPVAEHTYSLTGTPVHGERLRFVLDTGGRVTRMWVGPHPYDRLDE